MQQYLNLSTVGCRTFLESNIKNCNNILYLTRKVFKVIFQGAFYKIYIEVFKIEETCRKYVSKLRFSNFFIYI